MRRLPLLLAAAAVLLLGAGAAAFFFLRGGGAPAPEAPPGAAAPAAPGATPRPAAVPGAAAPGFSADEKAARALFDAADAFERGQPAEYEQRMSRWREIVTRHPTTATAKLADERHRAAAAALQSFLDREFTSARKDAQTLSAAGHFSDAVESIRSYRAAQTRDSLRARADVEVVVIENACRTAYNEAAADAKAKAAKGDYAGAVALFEALAAESIPEVAARCRTAADELRGAGAEAERYRLTRRGEDARRAIREELAPKLLALVRAQQFEEALRELSAAVANPANAPVKEELSAERAAVADAASFWEAFLKTLRSKSGTEVSLLTADGKKVSGRLERIAADRVVIDLAEVPFDKLHADQLVGWTVGRSLPAEDPVTYVKAGLYFFLQGREDLAKLYLATARELKGSLDASERVYRGGFLRAAIAVKK